MTTLSQPRLSVGVLAHNEAERIAGSLQALLAAGLGPADEVHVMVNGSTDATASIVRSLAAQDSRLRIHEIAFGDKSHAWNHYIHRVADPDRHHIMQDGDVRPAPGAVSALAAGLEAHADALACSALPRGGRRSAAWARQIVAQHGLPGNLYALRNTTVARIRSLPFFLPVGFVGDDTILRWILLRGLDPKAQVDPSRIEPCPDAFFEYDSFPLMDPTGLKALYKRQKRYSRRDLETLLLMDRLSSRGLDGLPRYASELYGEARLTTALRKGFLPRQVLMLGTYLEARRQAGVVPSADPWREVFNLEDEVPSPPVQRPTS